MRPRRTESTTSVPTATPLGKEADDLQRSFERAVAKQAALIAIVRQTADVAAASASPPRDNPLIGIKQVTQKLTD